VKAYQEAEISLQYVNNYQKAVTAIRRCRQKSPAFVELTSVCMFWSEFYSLINLEQGRSLQKMTDCSGSNNHNS